MARVCKRWTKEEEQILIGLIKKYPNNLQAAFRTASTKLDRTQQAIEFHWYSTLRHNETVFMTISPSTKKVNIKNDIHGRYNKEDRVTLPIWKRILKLLGLW